MKNIYLYLILGLIIIISLCIIKAFTYTHRHRMSDCISMTVKEIIYGDKNQLVTIEFSNISSKVCEFGDSSTSLNHMRALKLSKSIFFVQGKSSYAMTDYDFKKSFTIQPKQSVTIQVALQVENKKITSENKSIGYTFTYIRVGEASPQYGIYELSAAIESSKE